MYKIGSMQALMKEVIMLISFLFMALSNVVYEVIEIKEKYGNMEILF